MFQHELNLFKETMVCDTASQLGFFFSCRTDLATAAAAHMSQAPTHRCCGKGRPPTAGICRVIRNWSDKKIAQKAPQTGQFQKGMLMITFYNAEWCDGHGLNDTCRNIQRPLHFVTIKHQQNMKHISCEVDAATRLASQHKMILITPISIYQSWNFSWWLKVIRNGCCSSVFVLVHFTTVDGFQMFLPVCFIKKQRGQVGMDQFRSATRL